MSSNTYHDLHFSHRTESPKLAASHPKRYVHKKLRQTDAIRVLELLPGISGAVLSCRLFETDRSMSDGGYEALWYVWGNPVPACHLRDAESDSVLSITKNLYLALQALRYPDRSRILCVDAVCINQSDNDEKSHQVKNMDSGYTNTSMVIMWLDDGKFHEAVQQLHWLEESSEIDFSMAHPEPADFVDSIVAAIIVIVSSEWFTRLWVIQEFILAANV
ncbi:unnamed protein product [Alternaria alternata]